MINEIFYFKFGGKMKTKLYRSFIELTNSLPISKILMKFTRSRMSKILIPSYIKMFNVNVKEMEGGVKDFPSLHHFFIRKLQANKRPLHTKKGLITSPVDAVVEQYGEITNAENIIVKGQTYSIKDMLSNEKQVEKYLGGSFIVLYLSPSHYHRIHSPVDGHVINQNVLGNHSYPVNKWGLTFGRSPLSKNYRLVTEIKEPDGNHIAVVKVGAMLINTIELTHPSDHLQKGEELAYFSFGSTVVLLFEKDKVEFADNVKLQQQIKVGQALASKIK